MRILVAALITLSVLMVVIAGIYLYIDKESVTEMPEMTADQKKNEAKVAVELSENFETKTPNGKMPAYDSMSEGQLLDEVHGMTHQKVKASEKWGSSELTKDKVIKLYEVVQNKQFKQKEIQSILLEILEPWTIGDFNNAVKAHNKIWTYKEGNVGKATRMLTPSEEQEFIEKYYR